MYTGINEVRKHNPEGFIADFKRMREFVIRGKYGGLYTVKKSDVWKNAKAQEIIYELRDNIYVVKRTVMLLK